MVQWGGGGTAFLPFLVIPATAGIVKPGAPLYRIALSAADWFSEVSKPGTVAFPVFNG